LFAFSQSREGEPYKEDMEMAYIVRNMKSFFPETNCYLILQSDFKYVIENDKLYNGINIISTTEINEAIMANSL
jgi:hypothetical protein